jgi:RNA polymerase sigma factor (sigma-70 family)
MCDPLHPERCEARRERLREALGTSDLRRAVHLIWLRSRREGARLDEQLDQVDRLLSGVAERALENACNYDPERSGPIPWLVGVAINLLREQRRFIRRDREHVVPQHVLGEDAWRAILDRLVSSPQCPEEEERREAVNRALAQLNPEQRRVLELHFHRNLTWLEVGRILGITNGAARVRGHRALLALRGLLLPEPPREDS